MTPATVRLYFCIAVAVIAVAVADPLMEFASNAGVFGNGNYTDHSSADVIPALGLGVLFLVFQFFLRIRHAWSEQHVMRSWSYALDSKSLLRLLPCSFAVQIFSLYAMETIEQVVTSGHALGGTIWLGGPVLASLATHAVFCLLAAFVIAGILRIFGNAALRIVRLIRTLATRPVHGPLLAFHHLRFADAFSRFFPVVCRIGERAPPYIIA